MNIASIKSGLRSVVSGPWSVVSSLRGLIHAAAPDLPTPNSQLPSPALGTIVVSDARDRFRTTRIATYTADQIERVLANAFAGDLRFQWELFDLMEESWPRLSKALNELKRTVIALDWTMQPWAEKGAEPTASALERAQFVEGLLWSMRPVPARSENDFEGTLYDTMDAWSKAFAVLEIDWEQRSVVSGQLSVVTPRCTRWIHPRFYGYPSDRDELMLNVSEVRSAAQNAGSQYGQPGTRNSDLGTGPWAAFPEHKFLIAIARHKTGHPIGGALLRTLAFWWAASVFGAEWLLNHAQLFGQPLRWATYDPARKDLLATISLMMQNLGSSGWGVFPAGTVLELKEAGKTGGDNPQVFIIDFADKQVDLLVLGQTLTTDVASTGSLALGAVHSGIRSDVIQSVAEWTATVIQQLIRSICLLNYGNEEECPWFSPALKEVEDSKLMADRDKVLLDAGLELPKQWLYERHDIPMPDPGEETIGGRLAALPPGPGGFGRSATEQPVQASAPASLIRAAIADSVGAREQWLAPLSREIDRLARLAQNDGITDAELTQFIQVSARRLPELFGDLDRAVLADSLEAAMGSAVVAGARDAIANKQA